MQDKNNTYLVDKGWQSMELILDKEMPQKKKHRFLLLWFFGGIALLMSAFFIYKSYDSSSEHMVSNTSAVEKTADPISNDQKTNSPALGNGEAEIENSNIQSAPKSSLLAESNNGDVSKSNEKTTEESATEKALPPTKNVTKKVLPIINKIDDEAKTDNTFQLENKVIANNKPRPVSEDITNSSSTEKEETKEATPRSDNENQTLVTEVNSIQEKEEKETVIEDIIEKRELISFETIESLSDLNLLRFQREITILAQNYPQNYWYANVGGGGLWNPEVNLIGLNTSADLGYSFNNRIDIGITLGTGAFKYSANTQDKTAINVGGRITLSEAESANILRTSFRNASFLEFGLHGGLGLSDKLKLRVDVGYQYLYTSMFDRDPEPFISMDGAVGAPEDIDVSMSGGGAAGAGGGFENTESFDYKLSNHWFPYAGLGIEYQLLDKVFLGVSYRRIGGQLFDVSSSPLSMNRFALGFRYRFLQTSKK